MAILLYAAIFYIYNSTLWSIKIAVRTHLNSSSVPDGHRTPYSQLQTSILYGSSIYNQLSSIFYNR